jgi:hypothetical protein
MKEVKIKLKEWEYTCGDKCCYDYGVKLEVNGEECSNINAGDSIDEALIFTLEKLGYKVYIEWER